MKTRKDSQDDIDGLCKMEITGDDLRHDAAHTLVT